MGYIIGLVKYLVKGPFTNPVAFYIYGAGILAILSSVPYLFNGSFVQIILNYFLVKYLPPTSVEQIIVQIGLGTGVAGVKWYLFTPRIR